MDIYSTTGEIRSAIKQLKNSGKSVGFVPTMGCLHEGHVSLVKTSINDNNTTIVSIFVNPNQFNNPEDLANYPRTPERDIEKLLAAGCDIVFLPSVKGIYPEKDTRKFDFGNLDKIMEGKFRQDHFNGVAQVVSILLDIVKPDKAYFGQKDYQQFMIIKSLVRQLNIPVEIISCPIIREQNGLAMSSRNERLNARQREEASIIYKTLTEAMKFYSELNVNEFKKYIIDKINVCTDAHVEYFELADRENFKLVNKWSDSKNIIGCIAVYFYGIRLIDNINFNI